MIVKEPRDLEAHQLVQGARAGVSDSHQRRAASVQRCFAIAKQLETSAPRHGPVAT